MRCSTPPTSQRALSSSGASLKSRIEPIRVAVRVRPLRDCPSGGDGAEGSSNGALRGKEPVWRTARTGDRQSIFLVPGTPRVASWSSLEAAAGGAKSSSASSGGLGSGTLSDSGSWSSSARPYHEKARFHFDLCFDGKASNEDVFETAARDVLRSSLDGTNATVLAYGQTASGKTHSILGNFKQPGILPLAMQDLFKTESARMVGLNARVSYFEIFNERVIDLLAPSSSGNPEGGLPVKEDIERGFYVQGLVEPPVRSAKDVLRLIEKGEERRRYAQTRWNEYSSRSHVLFTLVLERPLGTPSSAGEPGVAANVGIGAGRSVKVNIVDLAGCENHKIEQSEDGRYINRSLFFLGEVISRLCAASSTCARGERGRSAGKRIPLMREAARDGTPKRRGPGSASRESTPGRGGRENSVGSAASRSRSPGPREASRERSDFIPYRDSKLTRILRASLGGNAMTLLLVTVHPSLQFVEQSMTSLRFAAKAQNVENCLTLSSDDSPLCTDEQSTIAAQQRVIEGLRQKLRALELGQAAAGRSGLPPQMPQTSPDLRSVSSADRGVREGGREGDSQRGRRDRHHVADDDFEDLPGGSWEEQRRMMEQFRGLQHEIEAKEQQLAAKTRLLSEREWQLGQLQNQLSGGCAGSSAAGHVSMSRESSAAYSAAGGVPARYGPPDEGGGLPVVDCGSRRPPPPGAQAAPGYAVPYPGAGGGGASAPSDPGCGCPPAAPPKLPVERRRQEMGDPGALAHPHQVRQHSRVDANDPASQPPPPPPPPPPPSMGPPSQSHYAMSGAGDAGGRRHPAQAVDETLRSPAAWSGAPSMARSSPETAARTRGGSFPPGRLQLPEDQDVDMPTAHQQVQSRAEDVVCLRRHERYVRRQQMPMGGPAPGSGGGSSGGGGSAASAPYVRGGAGAGGGDPAAAAAAAALSASQAGTSAGASPQSDSQKKLVEKLLYLAVMQINSVSAGPSGADGGSPKERSAAAADAAGLGSGDASGAVAAQSWTDRRQSSGASGARAGAHAADVLREPSGSGSSLGLAPPPSNPDVPRTPRYAAEDLFDHGAGGGARR